MAEDRTDSEGPPAEPAPHLPDLLLLRKIGQGAFGEVWLARTATGEYRAVKIVYRKRFDSDAAFEREFSGMRLYEPVSRTHQGLVDILHVGRDDRQGYYWYVMELADDAASGREIVPERYSPRTPKPGVVHGLDVVIGLGMTLAGALDHLHQKGLVHRDVKLSNIVFVDGQPRLADPGLISGITARRSQSGTAGYMPPEGSGSPAADIYALGMVLYEMATGLDRMRFPRMPAQLPPAVAVRQWPALNRVILSACAADSGQRYTSAAALREALQRVHVGEQPGWKVGGFRITPKAVFAATVVAIVLGIFAVKWVRREQPPKALHDLGRQLQRFEDAGMKVHYETPEEVRANVDGVMKSLKTFSGQIADMTNRVRDIQQGAEADRKRAEAAAKCSQSAAATMAPSNTTDSGVKDGAAGFRRAHDFQ